MQPADPFLRAKASPQCLSAWQRHRLLLRLADEPERRAHGKHAQECPSCAALLRHEAAEQERVAAEPVPLSLLLGSVRQHRWWHSARWAQLRWAVLAASAGAALVLVVAVGTKSAPENRWKGSPPATSEQLLLSVLRGGTVVMNQRPARDVGLLQAGDRLRVRVEGTSTRRLRLEGWEQNRWVVYFEGPAPAGGWLPIGITVTPASGTRLRLTSCPASGPGPCRHQVYAF